MALISIIIPIYNAQAHIERAIYSVLSQVNVAEIEIICIDDGSTDDSISVVSGMKEKFHNIYLYRQKNQGPAVARNLGLSLAKGRFVAFLDADDYVASDTYLSLYNHIVDSGADLVLHGYRLVKPDGVVVKNVNVPRKMFDNGLQCFSYLMDGLFGPSACVALYDLCFLRRHKILFPIDTNYEDSHFFREVILISSRILILDNIFYYYVQNECSRSNIWNVANLLDFSDLYLADIAAMRELNIPDNRLRMYEARALINVLISTDAISCRQVMSDFFKTYLNSSRKIVIYGTGSSGMRLARILVDVGLQELVFCDSDITKAGLILEGIQIIAPEDIHQGRFVNYKIIVASCYLVEIVDFLEENQITNDILMPLISDFYRFYKHLYRLS